MCGSQLTGTRHQSDIYYTCTGAQKRGWDACPSKSIPAGEIEQFVVEQLRCIGRDPALRQEVLAQARAQDEARTAELEAEQRGLDRDLASWQAEVRKLSGQIRTGDHNGPVIARLADLQERIGLVEGRARKVREQIHAVRHQMLDENEAPGRRAWSWAGRVTTCLRTGCPRLRTSAGTPTRYWMGERFGGRWSMRSPLYRSLCNPRS